MTTQTNRPVTIYISAATELMAERESLARVIAQLPVTLPWRILQTPTGAEPLDLAMLLEADLYILIMGSDIRAPVGLEWLTAQRGGRGVHAFLKKGIARTPAGQVFIGQTRVHWQPFTDAANLSRQVRRLLVEHLLHHAVEYGLTPTEFEQLSTLQTPEPEASPAGGTEAEQSAVILSRERYSPSQGVIIDDSP